MPRTAQEHHEHYRDQGYTVFEDVLSQSEIDAAVPRFDALITPDTAPPIVTGNADARRQLNSGKYCEPHLARFGTHPAVLETVRALMDRPFRLWRSPVPTVTFPGKAGGSPVPGGDWRGHVDWDTTGEVNVSFYYGIIYFTTVEPGGGGFTVVPESHRVVASNLADPQRTRRMLAQEFDGFPGLGPPKELTARAGSIVYYHPLMVHGASDNNRPQARRVLHTHYFPVLHEAYEKREREGIRGRFHQDHLALMDDREKSLIGL